MGLVLGLCLCEGDNKLGIGSVCQIPIMRLIGKTKPDHQVSLLRIPQLELSIEMSDLAHDESISIIQRFDLYTRRVGG